MPQMFKINNRVKYNELLMLRARLRFTFLYWKFVVEFNLEVMLVTIHIL